MPVQSPNARIQEQNTQNINHKVKAAKTDDWPSFWMLDRNRIFAGPIKNTYGTGEQTFKSTSPQSPPPTESSILKRPDRHYDDTATAKTQETKFDFSTFSIDFSKSDPAKASSQATTIEAYSVKIAPSSALTISEDSRARSDTATSPNIGNTLYDNANSINASSIPPHARVPPSSSGGASSGAVSIGGNNDSSNSSTPTPPTALPMSPPAAAPALAQVIPPARTLHGMVWFDGIFPLKITKWDLRYYFIVKYCHWVPSTIDTEHLKLLPPKFPAPFKVEKVDPNIKDGGMMLYFEYHGKCIREAVEVIQAHLKQAKVAGPFSLRRVRAFEVKGDPFIEDLEYRIPSNRLRVEFSGPDIGIERLYKEFRVFGRITDIFPMPPSSKDQPRYAIVQFRKYRSAASARNCLYGEEFQGEGTNAPTKIRLTYERPLNEGMLWTWITLHPRLSLPVIIAILATLSYLIFEPIRVFFVENHIDEKYSLKRLYSVIRPYTTSAGKFADKTVGFLLGLTPKTEGESSKVQEWEVERERLQGVLAETPETVILVQGVQGNGKTELVKDATERFQYQLYINLDEIIGQSESVMLQRLASQTGYFPLFGFWNNMSSLVDTLITSTTGAKAGLSSTSDVQCRKILETVTAALGRILAAQRISIEATLGKHANDATPLPPPELDYPLVVIDGFLSKEKSGAKAHAYLYDLIAEWGVVVSENGIAHVVFVTDNPSAHKSLTRQTNSRPVVQITLSDASLESSLSYVLRRLGFGFNAAELKPLVEGLGGRISDLEVFVRKIRSGSKPGDAYTDIVGRAVSELRKVGLGEDLEDSGKMQWTQPQLWQLVTLLAEHDEVGYDEVRFSPLFKGDETALHALERTGLIVLMQDQCRPYRIKPGRPVFRVAFQTMLNDFKLVATMGILTVKTLMSEEEIKVKAAEREMVDLAAVLSTRALPATAARELEERVTTVAQVIKTSNSKLNGWDADIKKYRAILAKY
ncbi:hypothetical protein SeMB42_g07699 [Synchytrium endobioticum]|uniref:Mitochondrial escape protein 2 n=1 Tax=Synchytrium endobioticum TaxID=286115 RepID=A0A507C1J1_9FUNG|nr:hypothetical protein SeMB42_g07699 [Synchytrium endobioticum]